MSTETFALKAESRSDAGTRQTRRLRAAGKLPAILYGHKQASLPIAVNAHDFIEALHHGHRLFSLQMAEAAETALVKDLQYDYLGKSIIHVDFLRVDLNERVTVEVPLEFRGTAVGTTSGGILEESLTTLEIECAVVAIPETIPVNVRDLKIGDVLHAKDIPLPPGCVLKTPPDAQVVICLESKAEIALEAAMAATAAEAAPTEPEVITERKREETAESQQADKDKEKKK